MRCPKGYRTVFYWRDGVLRCCCDGCAMLARTLLGAGALLRLRERLYTRRFVFFAGTDSDHALDVRDENLAVAESCRCGLRR